MRILITGATGFVGSNIARRLVKEGFDVHIVIRQTSNLELISDVKENLNIHIHDGTTEGIIEIVRLSNPEVVFHLASLFIVEHKANDIDNIIRSNILFGTQLLEAMKQIGIDKMINTGTCWQHFNNQDYNPVNLYAATKQAFEDILKFYVETTLLRVITLKLFDTYGPNDKRPKIINLLKKAAKENTVLEMSPGEQLIDLVYIDDVVEAYMIALDRLLNNKVKHHEVYAVSSGNPVSLRKIVEIYEEICGKKLNIQWGKRPYRIREVMTPWNRGAKLEGWEPKVSLYDGLKKILIADGNYT
ncbi:MAG: NAD(P)-dependent oxidoreductase [Thermodesulfovibrio sp.]|nr:NAD(P)-dependent oxidoreductase [Thermodesulfovibrio sp.]